MADELPGSDNYAGKKTDIKGIAFLEVGIFEVLFVILILILFFGLLNYFNILSISQVFPQQLAWLPRQPYNLENKTVSYQNIASTLPSRPSYTCPVSKDLCKNGIQISSSQTIPPLSAIGFEKLASGTPILAIIPGKYSYGVGVNKKGDKNTVLTIINDSWGLEADYAFKGTAYIPSGVGKSDVKQGDTIGWTSAELLDKSIQGNRVVINKNYGLVISVLDSKTKKFINLRPSQDGIKLDKAE